MVAVTVGGLVGLGRIPDGVAEDLGDAHAGLVLPGCVGAHARAATVDAEGSGRGGEKGGEVEEGCKKAGRKMHGACAERFVGLLGYGQLV